jgi:hypothetical protein
VAASASRECEGGAASPGLWLVAESPSESARFWAIVAAFGALWGAMEITLGTFLHVLRIPMTGTTLAAIAAALLVAQRQLLPRRGLAISTGIVAAICKSVSPGGLIFGPMIAISVEALLVEVALLLAPRSRPAAALAGSLAVCWATFQKVISQYVYYGGSIVDLYLALIAQGARLVGLDRSGGLQVLGGVVAVICVLGAAIALWGRSVGLQVARELREGRSGP